jgi:hypothetical protein
MTEGRIVYLQQITRIDTRYRPAVSTHWRQDGYASSIPNPHSPTPAVEQIVPYGLAVGARHRDNPDPRRPDDGISYCTGFTSPTRLPLLYVCRESSNIASAAYELSFGTKDNSATTRFDFEKDTLYIDVKDATPAATWSALSMLWPDMLKIQRLAFRYDLQDTSWDTPWDTPGETRNRFTPEWNFLKRILHDFENVKQLTLVNEDACGTIECGDDVAFTDPRYTKEILDFFSAKRYCVFHDSWVRSCERLTLPWRKNMASLLETANRPINPNRPPGHLDRRILDKGMPEIHTKTLMKQRDLEKFELAKARWQRDARSRKQRQCGHRACQES